MKRLSSFGFVPVSRSDSPSSTDKRPRLSPASSTPVDSSRAELPSEPQSQPSEPQQSPLPLPGGPPGPPQLYVRNDPGTYTSLSLRSLTDDDKLWLIHNAFRPDICYKFPHKDEYGKRRSFQNAWLRQFSWLCYSETCNGGFCINCFLFAKNRSSLGQLVTSPMTNFTRAKVTLEEHNKQSCHKIASLDVIEFVTRMEKGSLNVYQYMQNEASELVKQNRLKLLSILKTVVFCGKQMISLRGHREQGGGGNPGNFRALLQFRVDAGDSLLADHLKTAARNAKYISAQIQNDLISCTGEWIRNKILAEVKSAKFFSVCADEAADCSNKEQLPLVLRFVDATNSIREEFVDFVLCDTGTAGSSLADKILEALREYGLDASNLRGQAYDGAGNMAGKYNGVAANIRSTYPKAVYVHCAAHSLNLCVVAACSVQAVRNMMGTMLEVCLFFSNSPKRQLELERNIQSIGDATAKKLVNLCKTRWVARIDALDVFYDLFPSVVKTFEVISEGTDWNQESRRSAENLLTCITKFEFLLAFVVTKQCLGYIKGLTVSLQKRAKDICKAYSEVSSVIRALSEVRSDIDVKHKVWHDMALALGEKVSAPGPQLPRCCRRQTARSNTPGDTPEIYYRRTISIPFLDQLVSHLETRFSNIQQNAIMGMTIVPSVLMDESTTTSGLKDLLEQYSDDLPDASSLEMELHLWKCKWTSFSKELPDTPADALVFASQNFFPNIHCLLRLMCTIPVTSCECERSVSVLRRLKTYLRSSMGQERLSGLALMHINYGMDINLEEIVNIFARKHPRRMVLSDILYSSDD